MAAIMISVVLGFVLNEWRHHRAEMAAVEGAKTSIIMEIESNLAHTQSRHEYYLPFDDTLAVLADEMGPLTPLSPDTLGFGAFPPYHFRTGAYEAARASGALSNMDFDTIEIITDVYSTQNFYQEGSWRLLDHSIGRQFSTVDDYRRSTMAMLETHLPASQEFALRVLQGEDRSEVQWEMESRDLETTDS